MQGKSVNPKRQPLLATRAREMRHAPTASEAALFEALRGRRLGVVVKRQVPIDRYIVDLLVPSAKLVIEVDGRCHERRRGADARRERALQRLGYRVLRVTVQQVVSELDAVLERIRSALRS